MLGPRIGKYDKNGKARPILGHNILIGALAYSSLFLILYFAVIVSKSCRYSNDGDQTFVIFSIFERITTVEISATNTKNNVITSTVIWYTFNFPSTFKLAIHFLIFSIIVFPSFVNYWLKLRALKCAQLKFKDYEEKSVNNNLLW